MSKPEHDVEDVLARLHQEVLAEQVFDELPSEWIARCIPDVTLVDYQTEIVDAVVQHGKVSARGPRGLGKTALAAMIVIWFACTREQRGVDWKVVTTSGSWSQLSHYLWPEVHKWTRKVDWAKAGVPQWTSGEQLLKTGISLTNGLAMAASPEKPEMIEGAHADSVLVLFDESKIIRTDVFNAVEGIMSNVGNHDGAEGYSIAVSTPGAPMGRFYDLHRGQTWRDANGLGDWWVRHVTADECIDAGRIQRTEYERLQKLWGTDSSDFRNHMLGEFAADDDDSLIPMSWVTAAMDRWREWDQDGRPHLTGSIRLGVDVAGKGKDLTVLAYRRGHIVTHLESEQYTDNVAELGDQIANRMRRTGLDWSACVDNDGMGAGTAGRLRQLIGDSRVTSFAGGGHDAWSDVSGELSAFNNRAAAWWNVREMLDPALPGPRLILPPSDELLADLSSVRRKADGSGKVRIESKPDTKKRLGKSPDFGDSVVYSCWSPPPDAPPAVESVGYGRDRETASRYVRKRRG